LYPGLGTPPPGTPYEMLIRNAAEQGLVEDAKGSVDEWVAERLARHRQPGLPHVQQRADGRWVQINERKTTEGGTVAGYTNITATKRAEEKIRKAKGKLEAANALVTDEKQRARSLVEQTVEIPLAPGLFIDFYRYTGRAHRVKPQEGHHIFLRYRRFYRNDG